ncbi:LppP/LprE family lipoprotein [Nocardia sp. NPDC020380]|uniref:LppP/LprE family lipoprotein n=1 Tax=Nocardia sp. NPDC020380 TaxID=3364309 RepID=UPI0037B9333F
MKADSVLFAALTAGLLVTVTACGTASNQAATPTSSPGSVSQGAQPPQATRATQPAPPGQAEPSSPGDSDPTVVAPVTTTNPVAPQPPAVTPQPPTVAPVTSAAPYGSGHGLCFDLNSALSNTAIKSLAAPPVGAWTNPSASNDHISDGCDGVLSWMTVESGNIHPYTHVLFFTNGTYLGTATAKPYGYTEIVGKTTNTVSVSYRWAQPQDALCCPSGGPSLVTFTLSGGKVQASGQFPPSS